MIKIVYIVTNSSNKSVSFTNLSKVKDYLSQRLPFDCVLTIERKSYVI